MKTDRLSPVN